MKSRVLDAFEAMNEVYEIAENDFIIQTNLELLKGQKEPDWRKFQLSQKHLSNMKLLLTTQGNKLLKGINASTAKAFEIAGVPEIKFQKYNKKAIGILIQSAIIKYKNNVNKIWQAEKTTPLYNRILEATRKGLDEGLRVVAPNGRSYEFKSYMETKVRNTISEEIVNKQMELNKTTQNVFFLCNGFGDCATDHVELQNRVYYDDRYKTYDRYSQEQKEQIEKYIKANKLLSYQEVIGPPYWLTTRPNCRHKLMPVSLNQVFNGKLDSVRKSFYLERKGKYSKEKYNQSQQLRLCERNIRKYKAQLTQAKLEFHNSKSPQTTELVKHYQQLVSSWQARARQVVASANKNGKWLERDYERETRLAIVQDLGAKYGYDEKPTTPKTPAPSGKVEPIKTVADAIKNVKPITKQDMPKSIAENEEFDYEAIANKTTDNRIKYIYKNLNKVIPDVTLAKTRISAEFNGARNSINISEADDFVTYFHELGHSIDWNSNESFGYATSASEGEFKELSEELHNFFINNRKDKKGVEFFQNFENQKQEIYNAKNDLRDKLEKELSSQYNIPVIEKARELNRQALRNEEISRRTFNENDAELYKKIRDFKSLVSKKLDEEHPEFEQQIKAIDKEKKSYGLLDDIVDAVSTGKIYQNALGGGHGTSYYMKPGNKQTETIANFFSMKVTNTEKGLNKMKELYPELHSIMDKYIDKIANNIFKKEK